MGDESPLLGHLRTGKDHSTWGGGHRRHTVTVMSPRAVSGARERPVRSVKWRRRLTSGPQLHFVISMIFNHPNVEIQNGDLPAVQNSPNFVGRHFGR
jgi:hypothetical protein